jgi:PAS domain S-box-containing protein
MFKEQELILAQQAAGMAIWEWEQQSDNIRWQPGSALLFGRPLEELRTMADLLQCVAPDDRDRVWSSREAAVQSLGEYRTEYRVQWPNGEVRWVNAVARAVANRERGTILLGISQDITETKEIEERLRKQAERLRAQARLLDLAYEPILVRDHTEKITYWNEGAERLYGYTRAEALGRVSHELLKTRFPQPLDEIQKQIEAEGFWEGELIHTTKDGRMVHVESRWRSFGTNGLSTLETNFDLSHQKALQVARVWEEKARLIGELAHQINNPLTIAASAAHLLKSGCNDPQQEYIVMLENAITRIAEFIKKSDEIHRTTRLDEIAGDRRVQ